MRVGPGNDVVGTGVLNAVAGKVGEVVVEHLGHHVAGIHAAHREQRAVVDGLVPTQHIVGRTVGIGVIDHGVVGIALHGLVELGEDGGGIPLAVLVATLALLDQVIDPAGLEQVSQLDPLVHITAVPPVAFRELGQCSRLVEALVEQVDGLVDIVDAAHKDGLARVIFRHCINASRLGIGHLAIEVGHEHHAIGLDDLGHAGILVVAGRHSLVVHVGHVGIGTHKPPLVGRRVDGGTRQPYRHVVVGATIHIAGPVATCHAAAPGSKLVGVVGVKFNVSQSLIVFSNLGRGVLRVGIDVEPVVARGERQCYCPKPTQYD